MSDKHNLPGVTPVANCERSASAAEIVAAAGLAPREKSKSVVLSAEFAPVNDVPNDSATALRTYVSCVFEPDDLVEIRTLPNGKQLWLAAETVQAAPIDRTPPKGHAAVERARHAAASTRRARR